jgi:methylated-DNA-[protein]-cysteine S-methyltransferase
MGIGAVVASEKGICRVLLPGAAEAVSGRVKSALTARVAEMLTSYYKGVQQDFDDIPVDLGALTEFRARILLLVRKIPFGEIKTYGEVAAMASVPRAARAIGGALASNPVPIVIPCHRVVAADGKLTGFTAPGGLSVKKILLQMEGVEFKGERASRKIDGYKQGNIGMKKYL